MQQKGEPERTELPFSHSLCVSCLVWRGGQKRQPQMPSRRYRLPIWFLVAQRVRCRVYSRSASIDKAIEIKERERGRENKKYKQPFSLKSPVSERERELIIGGWCVTDWLDRSREIKTRSARRALCSPFLLIFFFYIWKGQGGFIIERYRGGERMCFKPSSVCCVIPPSGSC